MGAEAVFLEASLYVLDTEGTYLKITKAEEKGGIHLFKCNHSTSTGWNCTFPIVIPCTTVVVLHSCS